MKTNSRRRQKQIDQAVNSAVDEMANALDTMLVNLPKDADLDSVTEYLIYGLDLVHPQVMRTIKEGMLARRVLRELGVKL